MAGTALCRSSVELAIGKVCTSGTWDSHKTAADVPPSPQQNCHSDIQFLPGRSLHVRQELLDERQPLTKAC